MAAAFLAAFRSRTPLAHDTVELLFDLKGGALGDFRAGQFVTLTVGKDPAGKELRRSYSIAGATGPERPLRLIIRLVDGGPGSAFWNQLQVGEPVAMTGPHGFFTLPAEHPGDLVFAATGTGLVPVMAMLAELQSQARSGDRHVYWGLRNEADLFAVDEVQGLCDRAGARLHIFLSQPGPTWKGLPGRITPAILAAYRGLSAPTFYLVGNGSMIQELKTGLQGLGVDRKKQIRTESFYD
jgi:CDP-4-dehydro-6-deoxyglucose reductase